MEKLVKQERGGDRVSRAPKKKKKIHLPSGSVREKGEGSEKGDGGTRRLGMEGMPCLNQSDAPTNRKHPKGHPSPRFTHLSHEKRTGRKKT